MARNEQLLDIISEYEAISRSDLDRIVQLHHEQGGSLAELLVRESLIDEEDLFFLMSRRLGVPAIPEERLLHLKLSPEIRRRVPPALARECVLIPLDLDSRAGRLSVAMCDPTDEVIRERLQHTARVAEIRAYLARRSAILEVVETAYTNEVLDPDELEELPWLGQLEVASQDPAAVKQLDPSAEDPKVEIDPSLQEELAAYSGPDTMGGETFDANPTSRPHELVTDEMPPIQQAATSQRQRAHLEHPLEVRGHSLLHDDPTERRLLPPEERYPEPGDTGQRMLLDELPPEELPPDALSLGPRRPEVDTDPFPLIAEQEDYDGINELGPMDGLDEITSGAVSVSGGELEADALLGGPITDMEHEITQVVVTEDLIESEDMDSDTDGSGRITPLPAITQMEDLDGLLRELLPSVGVLVSMLEERIDPSGGTHREYGRLSRLVARELGMDELTISRVALASHLFSLDLALRREVGTDELWDVAVVFSSQPTAPGGLGPSLRSLGAKALGLAPVIEEGAEPVELRLIRLVVDYLELRSESEVEGGTDIETLAQLLRTGGADPMLVDALVRAIEATETPPLSIEGTTTGAAD
jgi:hypothetical protein